MTPRSLRPPPLSQQVNLKSISCTTLEVMARHNPSMQIIERPIARTEK